MKPNAPPPQLVISPAFWPRALILKKHCATSSISAATAAPLPSTVEPAPVFGRVDAIGSVPLGCTVLQHSQLTPWLSNIRMTP